MLVLKRNVAFGAATSMYVTESRELQKNQPRRFILTCSPIVQKKLIITGEPQKLGGSLDNFQPHG